MTGTGSFFLRRLVIPKTGGVLVVDLAQSPCLSGADVVGQLPMATSQIFWSAPTNLDGTGTEAPIAAKSRGALMSFDRVRYGRFDHH